MDNLPSPAQPADLRTMNARIRAADAMSQSLLFSLERQYLDVPFEKAPFIQPVSPTRNLYEPPYFLRLEQVGSGIASLTQTFTALQTALAACHQPGHHTLIFLVGSDGRRNHIYLGVRGHNPQSYASDFVNYMGNFLQGNWPGTRLQPCHPSEEKFKIDVAHPLSHDLRYAVALTGIPSLKLSDQPGYPQSLDRLLRGLRGLPFLYMIVAEPMPHEVINDTIYQCRDLVGRVHTLTKTTFNETLTTGVTTTESDGETWNQSITEGSSETKGATRQVGVNVGLGLLATTIAQLFPPAGLLSTLALTGAMLLGPSFSSSRQKSYTTNTSETISRGGNTSTSIGLSTNTAHAMGREYVNAHAGAAETLLQNYITRFEQARALGCWNVGVYLLANQPDIAQQGATQLRALLSGGTSIFEPIRLHDLKRVWKEAREALVEFEPPSLALVTPSTDAHDAQKQHLLEHPLGSAFNGLTTPLNTEELALLVNLPRREVPGIQVMATADFSLNTPPKRDSDMVLGHLLEGGETTPLEYAISPNTLAKHALVTGITGSGKSTTCRKLLSELHQSGVPFLVVEPAKDEYVQWAMAVNEELPLDSQDRIKVYMPGTQSWRGRKLDDELVLNPFDIVWLSEEVRPQILSHLDRLKSILVAAFPMQEVLPVLLEDALFHVYRSPRNWLDEELPPFDTPRPTLTQLVDQIAPLVRGKGYDKPVTANLTAALTGRLQNLRQGWKKDLFDQTRSTSWTQLFDQPVVINLSQLGDDADKALAMAVLLQFLYEYRQAQYEARSGVADRPLHHLTVIEEAHRVLSRSTPTLVDQAQANPQGKVAEMFANILSEIRAYGQGVLIVDQVPAKLIPDAIKNTNLKIVHRLVANDDRDAMAGCMTLTSEQTVVINRLRPGQAIVYGDLDDIAAWVQVER